MSQIRGLADKPEYNSKYKQSSMPWSYIRIIILQLVNRSSRSGTVCWVPWKTNLNAFLSSFRDVNNNIMELLIMAYACKTSSARSIVGVIPYLPYSKQCKMRKRGCIVSKLLAKMMCKSGLSHLITMDLHQKEIQGFFDCPVDNLRASPFLLQYIQESVRHRFCFTNDIQTKANLI